MLSEDSASAVQAEELRLNNNIEEAFEKWDIIFRRTFPSRII
jgi:hypothetical protein